MVLRIDDLELSSNMDDNNAKGEKRMGGAEKLRIKKQKILSEEAKSCKKIETFFSKKTNLSKEIEPELTTSTPTPGIKVAHECHIASSSQAQTKSITSQPLAVDKDEHQSIQEPNLVIINVNEDENCRNDNAELKIVDTDENCKGDRIEPIEVKITCDDSKSNIEIDEQANTSIEVGDGESAQSMFKKPSKQDFPTFFKFHPVQPTSTVTFNTSKAYFRNDGSVTLKREWLTFCAERKEFFCSFCLAFSDEENRFTLGCGVNHKFNPYERIKEHEKSKCHINSTESFLLYSCSKDIKSSLDKQIQHEVAKNRLVMQRLVDIIKLIGKRGLSYRGCKNAEAAYTLSDENLDHGNYLEIVLLMAKYDPILKDHVDNAIKKSSKLKERHEAKALTTDSSITPKPFKTGSLVTFLSKTTADYIIEGIKLSMERKIAEQIRTAEFFTIQIDSTQDINVHDQLCIIIRFVTNKVNECLLKFVQLQSSTGENLCKIVSDTLKDLNIDVSKCIGSSTDGASNMRGQYQGFSAWLNKIAPQQVHVWCYAHVLNLVLTDTTAKCVESVSLFSNLNLCAVFVRESYLRMAVWEEKSKFKCITRIGETRWWAKDRCLTKVFGSYEHPEESLFVDIIETFDEISKSSNFNANVRFKAKTYLESLLQYKCVLTAHLFLRIFVYTTPLSLYLQSEEMNIIQAFSMVQSTIKVLRSHSHDFETIRTAAQKFIEWANEEMEKRNLSYVIPDQFADKRISKKTMMPGEKAKDEPKVNEEERYRIDVFNIIYDQVLVGLEQRFKDHGDLYQNLYFLDPKSFKNSEIELSSDMFAWMSQKLLPFQPEITPGILKNEWVDFSSKWPKIKNIANITNADLSEETQSGNDSNIIDINSESDEELESEERTDTESKNKAEKTNEKNKCKEKESCRNCMLCAFDILQKYRLHTSAYSNLYLCYKYALTLSCTQVQCERGFSTLKYIQNRLRNCLGQEKLDAFLLMSVEKKILSQIDNDEVINFVAKKSDLLSKKLLF